MADTPQPLPRMIWLGMSLVFGLLGLAYLLSFAEISRTRKNLTPPLPVISHVADFMLTNQDSQIITLADLPNHVWIADIIFTRCAGPCPRMTAQMKSLQDALPQTNGAKLVTLTTDPDFDSPEVLKKYGDRFGADSNRWTFLTG